MKKIINYIYTSLSDNELAKESHLIANNSLKQVVYENEYNNSFNCSNKINEQINPLKYKNNL
jgi:hypothetical protein